MWHLMPDFLASYACNNLTRWVSSFKWFWLLDRISVWFTYMLQCMYIIYRAMFSRILEGGRGRGSNNLPFTVCLFYIFYPIFDLCHTCIFIICIFMILETPYRENLLFYLYLFMIALEFSICLCFAFICWLCIWSYFLMETLVYICISTLYVYMCIYIHVLLYWSRLLVYISSIFNNQHKMKWLLLLKHELDNWYQ